MKSISLVATFLFSIIVVYGSALLASIMKGHLLFENGLASLGYILLTLAIALPLMLYQIIAKKGVFFIISCSWLFIVTLFVSIYFTTTIQIDDNKMLAGTAINNLLIAILSVVILIIGSVHIGFHSDNHSD